MSFFDELRNKLEKHPNRNFDQRMRNLMNQEMGYTHQTQPQISRIFKILIPTAALSLMIGIYFKTQSYQPESVAALYGENLEFIQNLENLEHEELMGASDEEWAEVLEGLES